MNEQINNSNKQKTRPHYSGILGLLAIVLLFGGYYESQRKAKRELARAESALKQNEINKNTYIAATSESDRTSQNRHIIDSIEERNDLLLGVALHNYFERLDKKYTLGKFLNPSQIKNINAVIESYLYKVSKSDDIVYKYAKSYMPINANTPLCAFTDIVNYLYITPIELMPYGVEFDNGVIFRFYDKKSQNLFYKYLEDYELAFISDTTPNFSVPEINHIREEFLQNHEKIIELESSIENEKFVHAQQIAKFDATRDSLNLVIKNLKSKLK